jgi:hypothetical protein
MDAYFCLLLFQDSNLIDYPGIIRFDDNGDLVSIESVGVNFPKVRLDSQDIVGIIEAGLLVLTKDDAEIIVGKLKDVCLID